MSSIFTLDQKASLESIMSLISDTFMRPIMIWRKKNEVVISENPSHDFIYAKAPINTQTVDVPVSGIFNARILYGQKQTLDYFDSTRMRNGADQLNIRLDDGSVRLKLDPTGAAFIEGCQRITFDNMVFTIDGGKRPHGLFTPQYYTYVLKKQN